MKKLISILLTFLLLIGVFAVPASAMSWKDGQTIDENGNYTFENAYGFEFRIDDVNGRIEGEDNTVITNSDAYLTCNPNWAVSVLLAPTDYENVYEVVMEPLVCALSADNGLAKGINFDNGNICLVVHSAYSNPNGANWDSKVAAMALRVGDRVTLKNIDLNAGISSDGFIIVQDDPREDVGEVPPVISPEIPPVPEAPEVPDFPDEPAENVALGKPYTTSDQFRQGGADAGWGYDPNAPISYPDEDGVTMTDGILPPEYADYTSPEFAGWSSALPEYMGYHRITIDLLDTFELTNLKLWYGTKMLGNGISAPDAVEAYVSDNGIDWMFIDKIAPANDGSILNECVEFRTNVKARFVEFRVLRSSGWVFLTEAEAFTGNVSTDPDHGDNDLESELLKLLGDAPFNPMADFCIEAPESYCAGDEITVRVSVRNISAMNGIHIASFQMLYDAQRLLLINDLDESDYNTLVCIENMPNGWENFCNVANDYNEENEAGTKVSPINDGIINVNVFTDKTSASAAVKNDDELVFFFTFKALEDSKEGIGFVIPHASAQCGLNVSYGFEKYEANGGYAIVRCGNFEPDIPDIPEPPVDFEKEEIYVDGDLSDSGWSKYGWTEVTPDNGFWQAIPKFDTISYRYQFRTDDEKLYVAVEIDCAAVEGGNGKGTNVRFWINSNDEATVYTHFYDVFVDGTRARYNNSTTQNQSHEIESTINAVLTTDGERTYVEYSIDLAEFNGAEGFNYFICVSNRIEENVCLYYPAVPEPAEGENRLANLPYNTWYTEGQGVVDVEEIKLNQDGGSVDPNPDVPFDPETDRILIDSINAPSWGEDEVPYAPILVYGPGKSVGELIGGVWNAWWYKIVATYDEERCIFIISEKLPNNGDPSYADLILNENQIMILVFTGDEAKDRLSCDVAEKLMVGDALTVTGFGFDEHYAENLAYRTENGFDSPVKFFRTSDDVVVDPEYSVEEQMKEMLGEAFGDARFDLDIEAPETYKAGDDITVKVTVKNVTAEMGIHILEFNLYYDNSKLLLTNDIDENNDNALVCIEKLPSRWENLSYVSNDYDYGFGATDVVSPLNDGVITAIALTADPDSKYAVKNDGDIVFSFTFKALEDAEGDIGIVIPHAEAMGALNTDAGMDVYNANGDYAVIYNDVSLEDVLQDILGDKFDDAMLDLDIEAPDYYQAGDDVTVKVTVKNIAAMNGIHVLTFSFLYDCENLILTNALDDENEYALDCIDLPDGWENLTWVTDEYDEANDRYIIVNDGVINVIVCTASTSLDDAVTEDGELTFTFNFKAQKDSDWDAGFVIPNDGSLAGFNTESGAEIYHANGDYAISHRVTVVYGYEPDCENTGLTNGLYCPVCDEMIVEQEPIDALGHKDGEWITVIKPTCTEKGLKELYCAVCKAIIDTKEIDALGHDYKPTVTDPTCTEKGYTTYVCHCGDTYVDNYVDALGHKDGEWVTTLEPTCTEKGLKELRCTVCDEVIKTEEIDALGHDYKSTVTDPTCTEKGFTTYVCHCGDTYVDNYVDALGHKEGEWNTTLEPTCTEKGLKELRCTVCDEVIDTEEIDALGHKEGEWNTTLEPTCTEKGSKDLHCAVCDAVIKTEAIDALGHKDGEWETTLEPTCTEKGLKELRCTVCDEVIDTEEIDALDHEYEWVTTVEPTLDSEGKEEHRCTRCGDVNETNVLPALRMLGDINGNGEIDKYDYIMVKRNVMGTLTLEDVQTDAADVNGNGEVDKYDYILIKRHVMGTYEIDGAAN